MPGLKVLLNSTGFKNLKTPREGGFTFEHSAATPKWSLDRVTWGPPYSVDARPIFEHGGEDHFNSYHNDGFLRGGMSVNLDRRRIDFKRMSKFVFQKLFSDFNLRQAALQFLNPQKNTRVYNVGINLLAQIAGSGLINLKRHGLLPFPGGLDDKNLSPTYLHYFDDISLKHDITKTDGSSATITEHNAGIGDLQNPDNMAGVPVREKKYSMGDPGGESWKLNLENLTGISAFTKAQAYNISFEDSYSKVDLINKIGIIQSQDGAIPQWASNFVDDMVNFRFEVINDHDLSKANVIIFRAFIDSFDDNFTASHNNYKYNGRGEKFYTYESFDRKIGVSFKIAAQTRHEMRPLYQKLNYLAAQTAPNYSSSGRIRTPYMKLTIGDYFNRVPGLLTSVSIKWAKDYPWEIKSHPDKDKDMLVLPHVLDVNVQYQPIHNFTPNNSIDTPFIGIDKWINIQEYNKVRDNYEKGPAVNTPATTALTAGLTYIPKQNQEKKDNKWNEAWTKFKDNIKNGKVDPKEVEGHESFVNAFKGS